MYEAISPRVTYNLTFGTFSTESVKPTFKTLVDNGTSDLEHS